MRQGHPALGFPCIPSMRVGFSRPLPRTVVAAVSMTVCRVLVAEQQPGQRVGVERRTDDIGQRARAERPEAIGVALGVTVALGIAAALRVAIAVRATVALGTAVALVGVAVVH